ncbi:signal peptidase II [Flexibacter flexilis DSM 6793]|uniref:Lipoprotein signal peptidase n=1 Tax=Flexibacter flexilis DSM 6793 TaxID=927664 RepID=A0A1I1DVA3_9BACT|nr:lipoprotein signal peptidase [Flexibacter flexilis]SFB76503.1 signal peptidase II [Flexibacter flexilis DSM 6793]
MQDSQQKSQDFYKYYLVSLLVIGIDQAVKLGVHFNMEYGAAGEIKIFGDWFKLYYIRNPGMAFGMELGHQYGKLMLSVFRLFAMFAIAYYLRYLAIRHTHKGFLYCLALILGGAVGNLVDSIFYGVWLDIPAPNASTPWFHGQVVDMLYVDLWQGILPDWVPIWGGEFFSFWPIFNIADSAIFVGVVAILIFQNTFFPQPKDAESNAPAEKKETE